LNRKTQTQTVDDDVRQQRLDRLSRSVGATGIAAETGGRYAILTVSANGVARILTRCETVEICEQAAQDAVLDGWTVAAMYDLDILDGDPPAVSEGATVRYDEELYVVGRVDEELVEGQICRYMCLHEPGSDISVFTGWDSWIHREPESECVLVDSPQPDDRLPVRHEVAAVRVLVVFDRAAAVS
jgi:hypothetical protein